MKNRRKPIYRPTAEDMEAAAARAIVKKHPHPSLAGARRYLEGKYQAELIRLRCESEA